jgi:hypothetical protein
VARSDSHHDGDEGTIRDLQEGRLERVETKSFNHERTDYTLV